MSDAAIKMWICAWAATSTRKLKRRGRNVVTLGCVLAWMLLAWGPHALALDPSLDIRQYAHTAWKVRDGVFKGTIRAIAQTPDGYLWLGTEFGLVRFDGVKAVPWQPPPDQPLPSGPILGLLTARDGTLWIGADTGLASWKDGKLTQYPELAGQGVFSLLEDRKGTVWAGSFGTPTGKLCRIQNDSVRCYGEDGSLGTRVFTFGLPGMRERAENVGGRLEVRSRVESGTEVELSIPGDIAYGKSARRSWFSRVLPGNSREHRNTEPGTKRGC